jgi:hypothetical protein
MNNHHFHDIKIFDVKRKSTKSKCSSVGIDMNGILFGFSGEMESVVLVCLQMAKV